MALVVAWLVSGVAAIPISPAEDSIFSYRCSDIEYCRTIPGIVWSCLATIFACTWVAVHPNVPAPKSKVQHVVFQRVAVTICALLVPEYIVAWSVRQWLVANQIVKEVTARNMEAAMKAEQTAEKERSRKDSGLAILSPIAQESPQGFEIPQAPQAPRGYQLLVKAFKTIFIRDHTQGEPRPFNPS